MEILYEDNHLLIVNKAPGQITQGDKTGDKTLSDLYADYIRQTRNKPGNVFIHPVHRLDRPVSGVVVLALTSKALSRTTRLFAHRDVKKIYWALTSGIPQPDSGELHHWLCKNEKLNKSYIVAPQTPGAREALLSYKTMDRSQRYSLLSVELHTGRHHQIRAQLAAIGCCIRGDLKYGAPRSNPDGSISLHALQIQFEHPVSGKHIDIKAPLPPHGAWNPFRQLVSDD